MFMCINSDAYISKIVCTILFIFTFIRKMLHIRNVLTEKVYALTWHLPHQWVNCRKMPSSAWENFFKKHFKQGARCSSSQSRLQPTPPPGTHLRLPPATQLVLSKRRRWSLLALAIIRLVTFSSTPTNRSLNMVTASLNFLTLGITGEENKSWDIIFHKKEKKKNRMLRTFCYTSQSLQSDSYPIERCCRRKQERWYWYNVRWKRWGRRETSRTECCR